MSASKVAFSSSEFRPFKLANVETLSHDVKKFTVALPTDDSEMGMTTASCLMLQGETEDVVRPYTPTTLNSQKGHFELVIKRYPDGKVSSYMHGLQPGDEIRVKGPIKKLALEPNMKQKIGMIAGGTGITPMYQCILEILRNPEDKTEVSLLYANKTPADILLRSELDSLAAKHSNFKVLFKVSDPDDEWNGPLGHIDAEDIKKELPAPGNDHLIFVCGPPPMMDIMSGGKAEDKSQGELKGLLKDLNYTPDMVYKF